MRSTAALSLVLVATGCSRGSEGPAKGAATTTTSTTAPVQATAPAVSASAPAKQVGPLAAIPAGKLVAGTACGDHPMLPGEELLGEAVDLGAFDIDAFPYPNDPEKPPEVNVSRDDAAKLCEARGRRLCTELEWEHACKGPASWRYEYGDRFDSKACPSGLGSAAPYATFPKCVSRYGAHAMHGFTWEWTASDWKRGGEEGKATQRGGFGNQPYAHLRCSGGRGVEPAARDAHVGFRCCGGPKNTREVEIPKEDPAPAPIDAVEVIDDALAGRIKRALVNGSFKDPEGMTGHVAKVWRWHPAPREELLVVRYELASTGGADGGASVQPLLVRLCEKSAQLVGRTKTAFATMEAPTVKADSGVATIALGDGTNAGNATLAYQFAQVAITEPPVARK